MCKLNLPRTNMPEAPQTIRVLPGNVLSSEALRSRNASRAADSTGSTVVRVMHVCRIEGSRCECARSLISADKHGGQRLLTSGSYVSTAGRKSHERKAFRT